MLLLLLLLPISLFSQDLNEGLLLHYSLNATVADQSTNSNDGMANNLEYTDDRFGNEESAAWFNGENSFIELPNIDDLKPNLPVSFAFWVRYDSDSFEDRALFNTSHEEDVSNGVFLTSRSSTGQFGLGYGDGSDFYNASTRRTFISDAAIQTGEWVHLVLVVSGPTDMKIFVNCEDLGGEYSGSGSDLSYSALPGSLGRHDQNTMGVEAFYFEGALDDFRYYDRVLTEEEISLLCASSELEINIFASSPPSCKNFSDGVIEVEGLGGFPPYEYSINGGDFVESNVFEGLDVGEFEITVRDSQGDEAISSIILESTDEFEIDIINISETACNETPNGSLEVLAFDASGSSLGYTYSLDGVSFQDSGFFDNLVSGLYTVIVENADGCLQEINLPIEGIDDPQISAEIIQPTCDSAKDGSIILIEENGLSDIIFDLDNLSNIDGVFSNLGVGEYVVMATSSSGCISSINISLESDQPCEEEEVLCPLLQNRLGMQINKWENETYTLRFNYRNSIDYLGSCEYDKLFEMIYFHLMTKSTNSITTHALFEDYCLDMETISKGDYTPLTEKMQSIEPSYDIIEDIDNIRSFILSVDEGECIKI